MKLCENCFERNSDGATHCVICGESLTVAQVEGDVGEEPISRTPAYGTPAPARVDSHPDIVAVEDLPPEGSLAMPAEPAFVREGAGSSAEIAVSEPLFGGTASAPSLEDAASEPLFERRAPAPPAELAASGALPAEGLGFGIPAAAEVSAGVPITVAEVSAAVPPAPVAAAPARAAAREPTLVPRTAAPSGKAIIEVYHDTEPRVVHRHVVVNDVTVVGREDPQRDVFPDLDLGKLEKLGVSARSVSREHLRVLRQGGQYYLFIYRGSTGTQVNKSLIDETHYAKRLPLNVGDRIILGGKARLKLTVQE